jgi:hypothetical protein
MWTAVDVFRFVYEYGKLSVCFFQQGYFQLQ